MVEHYRLIGGLDQDAFGVALLLIPLALCLEKDHQILTPTDALVHFDGDGDHMVYQSEFEEAMKVLGYPKLDPIQLRDSFMEYCDAQGRLEIKGFQRAFAELCDPMREMAKRKRGALAAIGGRFIAAGTTVALAATGGARERAM